MTFLNSPRNSALISATSILELPGCSMRGRLAISLLTPFISTAPAIYKIEVVRSKAADDQAKERQTDPSFVYLKLNSWAWIYSMYYDDGGLPTKVHNIYIVYHCFHRYESSHLIFLSIPSNNCRAVARSNHSLQPYLLHSSALICVKWIHPWCDGIQGSRLKRVFPQQLPILLRVFE